MIDAVAVAALTVGSSAVTWGIILKHGERLARIEEHLKDIGNYNEQALLQKPHYRGRGSRHIGGSSPHGFKPRR
jgi:hypothetical protein